VTLKLFENFTLKLVALIISIIIWILVVGEKRSEVRLTVPLELRNLSSQLEVSHQNESQVEVTIRGFSSVVKQITPVDIDVYIDLSNVVEGPNSFGLFADDIVVPLGATVIQISPSQIELQLDATADKTVGVKPMVRGTPKEGYSLGKYTAEPKVITVTGARRLLNDLASIETETIPIDNIAEDTEKKVKLRLPAGIRVEKEEERIVTVSIPVIPKMANWVFEEVPLLVEDESRQFTLSPQVITVLLYGPEVELSQMTPESILAYIETGDLATGQSVVQPIFTLSESITVKGYYPKTITINIAQDG
jgi:YbbR domain-containing protein